MFDLHCHLLPAIDDGAKDLAMSLEMARMAVADGIQVTACTPHIYPGLYENSAPQVRAAIAALRAELDREGIPLRLVEGAEVHLAGDLVAGIRSGRIPTIAGSRYLLFEPPHHCAPPRLEESLFGLVLAGFVPVITHPERLTWVGQHYDTFVRAAHNGSFIQVTAGALTGRHGRRAREWGQRFVGEGHAHILATDAHHPQRRPPLLAEARDAAAVLVGAREAEHLVLTRPRAMILNEAPATLPPLPAPAPATRKRERFWNRLLRTA